MTDGEHACSTHYPTFGPVGLAVSSAVLWQPYRCSHRCWKQAEIPNWFSNTHPPPRWTTRTNFPHLLEEHPGREEDQLQIRVVLNILVTYQKICPSRSVVRQIGKRAERPMSIVEIDSNLLIDLSAPSILVLELGVRFDLQTVKDRTFSVMISTLCQGQTNEEIFNLFSAAYYLRSILRLKRQK
jgi:hypothetical protein